MIHVLVSFIFSCTQYCVSTILSFTLFLGLQHNSVARFNFGLFASSMSQRGFPLAASVSLQMKDVGIINILAIDFGKKHQLKQLVLILGHSTVTAHCSYTDKLGQTQMMKFLFGGLLYESVHMSTISHSLSLAL